MNILKISRPRFWIYLFGPYMIASFAAYTSGYTEFSWQTVWWGMYFLFPANLLIYGVNDIFDFETDRLNDKKQKYEALVVRKDHKRIVIWMILLHIPFVVSLFWISHLQIFSLLCFLFFGIFYSAKPIRAKSKPILDSFFNILYVFPGVFGYFLHEGEKFSWYLFFTATLWCMAMHAYSAIPDQSADKKAGISTIATLLGGNGTLLFCFLCYVFGIILSVNELGVLSWILGGIYIVFMALSFFLLQNHTIFKLYKAFPWINAFSGMLLFFHFLVFRL